MGDNPLNNTPSQSSLLASINSIYGALRGAFVPRDSAGVVGAGAADIGSTTVPWDVAYINSLNVGGLDVDVAALAVGAAVYPFTASNLSFDWPGGQTRALMLLWGSASGGGGGGGNGGDASDNSSGNSGGTGGDGAAATITIGGMTYSSGASPGGRGGDGGARDQDTNLDFVNLKRNSSSTSIPGGAGGDGGNTGSGKNGGGGESGSCTLRFFVHDGLSQGDSLSIVVPTALGSGGGGGLGGNEDGGGRAGSGASGSAGTSPGLVIMLALP